MDNLLLSFLKDNMITLGLAYTILKGLAVSLNLSTTNSILDSIWGGLQAARGNGLKGKTISKSKGVNGQTIKEPAQAGEGD